MIGPILLISLAITWCIRYVSPLQVLANNQLASGSDDKTIKVWNVAKGECVRTLAG